GLVIFTLASAACGFAQNPTQLIVFRVVQGLGGALLTPQTLSVLTVIFPPDKRGAAFGIWGATAGVATIAGPVVGGWLVTDFGWRWIFFVNLPVGAVALVGAAIVMPNLKLNRRHRLDWLGTVLVTAGLFLITFGIFKDRNFSIMNYVVMSIAFGMFGLFLPLTIFLQSVLGLTALQAGLTTAPMSLISMFVAPVAGRLADRIGGKWILFVGLSLFSAGMGILIASS